MCARCFLILEANQSDAKNWQRTIPGVFSLAVIAAPRTCQEGTVSHAGVENYKAIILSKYPFIYIVLWMTLDCQMNVSTNAKSFGR